MHPTPRQGRRPHRGTRPTSQFRERRRPTKTADPRGIARRPDHRAQGLRRREACRSTCAAVPWPILPSSALGFGIQYNQTRAAADSFRIRAASELSTLQRPRSLASRIAISASLVCPHRTRRRSSFTRVARTVGRGTDASRSHRTGSDPHRRGAAHREADRGGARSRARARDLAVQSSGDHGSICSGGASVRVSCHPPGLWIWS